MYTFDHSTISWAPQTVASVFLLVNFIDFFCVLWWRYRTKLVVNGVDQQT